MSRRGRPANPLRIAARKAGKVQYRAAVPCSVCGGRMRYVSNSGCVACAIESGIERYASFTPSERAKAAARRLELYHQHKGE